MTLRVYAHAVERADEALAQILGEALDVSQAAPQESNRGRA
jgi:hypothetical protein